MAYHNLKPAKVDFADDSLVFGRVPISISILANGGLATQAFFIADRPCQLVAARETHSTAGTDGSAVNVTIEKLTGTTAPGSGTAMLTNNSSAGFNLKGTANTGQAGLMGTVATCQLAVGDRLGLKFAGVLTVVAGLVVTAHIKKI